MTKLEASVKKLEASSRDGLAVLKKNETSLCDIISLDDHCIRLRLLYSNLALQMQAAACLEAMSFSVRKLAELK